MCGIFGMVYKTNDYETIAKKLLTDLFLFSETRGKESSGFMHLSGDMVSVMKSNRPASDIIKTVQYKKEFEQKSQDSANRLSWFIGHSRLVTNGSSMINGNNQPVLKDNLAAVHNGIIVNDLALWERYPSLKREYEVDTEIMLSLLRYHIVQGEPLTRALAKVFAEIKGTASVAISIKEWGVIALSSNNGSLFVWDNLENGLFVFASEAFILKKAINKRRLTKAIPLRQLGRDEILILDYVNGVKLAVGGVSDNSQLPIHVKTFKDLESAKSKDISNPTINNAVKFSPFEIDNDPIDALNRCARCILPETMPYIEFDNEGVCNYCHGYIPQKPKDKKILLDWAQHNRKSDSADCVVSFSGGRDSCYSLHYLTKELDMHPIAYTYDWGMVTDIARRNQARLCGKLGVEQILLSADIVVKRDYIRRNVEAWLKKPDLGIIPLFMAGDKQYFYYANKMRKQLGLSEIVMASNPLERTDFKSGFCGVKPISIRNAGLSDSTIEKLSLKNITKMAGYYLRQFGVNPGYINRSIFDTMWAFGSYYCIPHNYMRLYDYVYWNEQEIEDVLLNEYDWEIADDTKTTWRIGDGTAPFYNYIYYTVAGFSENDTFRSNQVREGVMDRETALKLSRRDNQPRFDSIKWYCDAVGLDIERTLARIQQIPKLYTT